MVWWLRVSIGTMAGSALDSGTSRARTKRFGSTRSSLLPERWEITLCIVSFRCHECYATSGPMKLAAALLGSDAADCLAQESHGVDTLKNPEPNFFLLGDKSYGRNNTFLLRVGWQQVEEVFEELSRRS